jgi:hypothetical protein
LYHQNTDTIETVSDWVHIEKRAYPRFPINLAGLCSATGSADVPFVTVDISLGGIALTCEVKPDIGTVILVQIPEIGLLTGRTCRHLSNGFAFSFAGGALERMRVRRYLAWHVTRNDSRFDVRHYERIVPLRRIVKLTIHGQHISTARIIDVSRSGVAISTSRTLQEGDLVDVGSYAAVTVRVFFGGMAARFVRPFTGPFDASVRL